jgi:hypothetical protein
MWGRILNFLTFRKTKRVPVAPTEPTIESPCDWHFNAPQHNVICFTCGVEAGEKCKFKRGALHG